MAKIKKGDLVVVIAGQDRGKQGRVLKVNPKTERIIVEGVQRVTRHVKVGQSNRGTRTGGIETVEVPIHVSNVMLVDPDTKRGARVGFRLEQEQRDGRLKTVRVRYTKTKDVDGKPAKKSKSKKDGKK